MMNRKREARVVPTMRAVRWEVAGVLDVARDVGGTRNSETIWGR
jgi:hypothetical protein